MKVTENYRLKKPEITDFYNVEDFNGNMEVIDEKLKDGENHAGNKENPHNVTKEQIGLGNVDNTADENKSVKYATSAGSATKAEQDANGNAIADTYAEKADLTSHETSTSNPHSVTKSQVGLGNVPNVATNDQTPTYTVANSNTALSSGEKLSVAFGKIAKAINSLISHLASTSNPHSVTKSQVGLGNVENKSSATIRGELTKANVTSALGFTPINSTIKGVANGLAELDKNGIVPSSQLPSYVDDVLEFASQTNFPTTGESGKIYIAQDTNLTYRWSGSAYTEISKSLALGTTSSTAFRGDRGNTAYNHSLKTSGNPHGVTKSEVGLGNVPNVATNDQTPTYTVANSNTALSSGEKLSVAFGKIAKAINSLISHLASTSNPHSVTKSQVGLGNVDNTADSNKSVKYATSAGSATKATQDGSGNVIANTYSKVADVIDNVSSASTTKPLSANQGRLLKNIIDDYGFIIENLGIGQSMTTKTVSVPSGASSVHELITAEGDADLLVNISGYVQYSANGTGYRARNIQIGNTIVNANTIRPTGSADNCEFNGLYKIPKGQSLKLALYQTSGVAINATINYTTSAVEL